MAFIRLGQVDYLNCLPVYHALGEGLVDFRGSLVKGTPAELNGMLLEGSLDAAPISSIEYARNVRRYLIIPDISISADGRVASILLFSKHPVTELDGRTIAVTTSSATSVVLLKVLMEHYFHVQAEFIPVAPDLTEMLRRGEGALLIGDDAMVAHSMVADGGPGLMVTDLGEAWKQFSGESMVYALWAVREDFARDNPGDVGELRNILMASKDIGMSDLETIIEKSRRKTGLPYPVLKDYFKTIRYGLDEKYRKALCLFYDYAYKSGIIEERVKLRFWGESGD